MYPMHLEQQRFKEARVAGSILVRNTWDRFFLVQEN